MNHVGFFVARDQSFYRDHGTALEITDPAAGGYQLAPAKQVENGTADFALCPTESVISYRTQARPFLLRAVAALLQADLSAVAVGSHAAVGSPRALDGRSYASCGARYEDAMVRQKSGLS